MTTLHEIYSSSWKKYEKKLAQIRADAQLPSSVVAIIYNHSFQTGEVISIPVLFHECLQGIYLTSLPDNMIFINFETLIQAPPLLTTTFRNAIYQSCSNQAYCFDHIAAGNRFYPLPWQPKFHYNKSASWLTTLINSPVVSNAQEYMLLQHCTKLHSIMNDLILNQNNAFYVEHFKFSHKCPPISQIDSLNLDPRFFHLTHSENLCFLAIYNKQFETKQLAHALCRSPRTIEGILSSMIQKLELNNRYELFIRVAKSHTYIRYLLTTPNRIKVIC